MSKRLRPNLQRSRSALLHEHKLPIVVAQTGQLLVVVDVKERFTRAFRDLPGEVGHEIIAVEVDLVGHVADFVALSNLSFTSVSPAMAKSVGNMSRWATMSLDTWPGLILPGQRTIAGTR